MYYTVYQTTHIKTGMIYVGVHKTDKINDRYLGSGTILTRAIRKYGKRAFKKEILAIYDNEQDMLNHEASIVNEEFINRKDTYNIVLGGGYPPRNNKKIKIHNDTEEKYIYDHELKYFLNNGWAKGTPQRTKDKMSKSRIGYTIPQEIRDKMSRTHTGKKKSKEHAENIGKAKTGKNNSLYGKKYINNGIVQKRIHIEEYQQYENDGWVWGVLPSFKENVAKSKIGRKLMVKDNILKYITKDNQDYFLNDGWVFVK